MDSSNKASEAKEENTKSQSGNARYSALNKNIILINIFNETRVMCYGKIIFFLKSLLLFIFAMVLEKAFDDTIRTRLINNRGRFMTNIRIKRLVICCRKRYKNE